MLDRLSAGFVTLPPSTYDLVLILSDADGTRRESTQLLGRDVYTKIVDALKPGGKVQSQDGKFGQERSEYNEAILAGLVAKDSEGWVKPDYSISEAVPLRFGKKKEKSQAVSNAGPPVATVPITLKRKSVDMANSAGVGFVDFSDDLGEEIITGEDYEDDELIDEDTLLGAEDMKRDIVVPPECIPRVGKRRRACKDCTCGLAAQIEKEEREQRAKADSQLKILMLEPDDLAEVDFTVQGKVGSCGNCSLGDAFRCDGCPYRGFGAWNEGEEVRLLNNEVQL